MFEHQLPRKGRREMKLNSIRVRAKPRRLVSPGLKAMSQECERQLPNQQVKTRSWASTNRAHRGQALEPRHSTRDTQDSEGPWNQDMWRTATEQGLWCPVIMAVSGGTQVWA